MTGGITAEGFPIGTTIGPNGTGTGVLVLKLDPRIAPARQAASILERLRVREPRRRT